MSIVMKRALARRAFLRGLGSAVALPFLDAMVPALSAAPKSPTRLGFVYVPNGVIMERWTPAEEGAGFEFTPIMKPLEPFRERLLVFSGLAQANGQLRGDPPGDHARAGASWLTGAHPKFTEGADLHAGISADQAAAQAIGRDTLLGSLEMSLEPGGLAGTCDSGYSCAYSNTISWKSPSTPLPMETNPRAVFERLFGDTDSTDPQERRARAEQDRSILDFVSGGLTRLKSGLGAGDRNKLDEFLDAIRDIERRIQIREKNQVKLPVMARPDGLPEEFDDYATLMLDLLVLAWQADLTRVTTVMIGKEASGRAYPFIGVPDGHHSITHHDHDPEKIEKVAAINAYHVELFAHLLEKLRGAREADESLLGRSLLLYGSSLSDGNAHHHYDLPLLLAGDVPGGRHLRYPSKTPMNNLLVSMLNRAGAGVDALGDSTGEVQLTAP